MCGATSRRPRAPARGGISQRSRFSPLPILILRDGRPRRRRIGEGWPARASKRQEAAMKDPVCGMEVDPAKAAGTSEYQGTTYYFCAKSCKTKFDANPKQYV